MKKRIMPLSKSWAIRMIFLDMLYGKKTGHKIIRYFEMQDIETLSDDIQAALHCAQRYTCGSRIFNAGNSGTVCRFITYIFFGTKHRLYMRKQLKERVKDELKSLPKNLTEMSLTALQSLGTSQYASAALLTEKKPIKNLHPKCKLTIEAWETYFKNNGKWIPKYDEVIIGQLRHFLYGEKIKKPIAEDYCYLRAFNLITYEEGKRRWPELARHESNRLKVMEAICKKGFVEPVEAPDDHRVVMAVALRQVYLNLPVRVTNKRCVSKSWPQFWQWLREIIKELSKQ